MVDISIAIPLKNGARYLADVLDAVAAQKCARSTEMVVVDSGSTDGSLEILRGWPVRVFSIPPRQFNHGLTRNLAIEKSSGRYVVLLTQDATPVGQDWLETLVGNLEQWGVAGVYCRQVPRPDADPVTRRSLEQWIGASLERREQRLEPGEWDSLRPYDRYLRCYFDNVCSAVRRAVWEKIPFPETYFAEDTEWGKKVVLAGYRTVYEPRAAVIHSHDRSARYELRRTYVAHRRLYALFGLRTIPTRRLLMRAFFSECAAQWRTLRVAGESWSRLAALPAQALASTTGQYLGARDEIRGRPVPRWRV